MTPSAFFERIRSAVLAFWREDTSPKKRRTDSGEEALLSAEISATRSKVVFCLFFVGLVAVLGKAFWLQCGISTDFLQKQGEARYARTLPVPAQRGQIFDRNGVVLASTIPARSVWAEPEEALKLTDAQFDQLGALLDESGAAIRERLQARKNKSFVYIDRQIEVEKGEAVRALQLPGIHVNNEVRRNYPDGPISAHVVGFTDSDNNGREGVELANNEILSGKQGSRRVIRDRLGRIVEDVWVKEGEVGTDVVLSIDSRLQFIAHKALQNAVERHQAKAGAVVVVDVRTGEILAMSNWPTYDPNSRRFVRMENIRNRVLTDTFEPGSTMKPFAIAKALDLGIVRPDTLVQTAPGKLTIGDRTIGAPSNSLPPFTQDCPMRTSCKARAIPFPTKRGFWKPMPNRMDFLICAGTPTTVIPVRTFKDPDFKPCLQTLKQGKSGNSVTFVRYALYAGRTFVNTFFDISEDRLDF